MIMKINALGKSFSLDFVQSLNKILSKILDYVIQTFSSAKRIKPTMVILYEPSLVKNVSVDNVNNEFPFYQ